MRTPYSPTTLRRILCVFPCYARSFGTFQHASSPCGGMKARTRPPKSG